MSEALTPDTDAAAFDHEECSLGPLPNHYHADGECVSADFAREMERERDELKCALRKIIEMSRREAEAKLGDADFAELGSCVIVARDALGEPFKVTE